MKNLFFLFPTWTENQRHGNQRDGEQSPAGNRTSKNHVTIFRGRISNSPPAFSWQAAALISRSRQRHDPRRHQHFVRLCTDRTCRPLPQKVSWAGSVERGTQRHINSLMLWLFSKCFRRAGRGQPQAPGAEDGDVGVKLNQQTAEGTWRDGWPGAVEERANTSEDKCLNCFFFLNSLWKVKQAVLWYIYIIWTQPLREQACVCQTLIQLGGCESLCNLSKEVCVYVKIQRMTSSICTVYDIKWLPMHFFFFLNRPVV